MDEYIEKSKLKEYIEEYCNPEGCTRITAEDVYKTALTTIECVPTADVVEVVRCKDCKHYEIGKSYTPYCNNVMNLFEEMKPTDFCSYGEKK